MFRASISVTHLPLWDVSVMERHANQFTKHNRESSYQLITVLIGMAFPFFRGKGYGPMLAGCACEQHATCSELVATGMMKWDVGNSGGVASRFTAMAAVYLFSCFPSTCLTSLVALLRPLSLPAVIDQLRNHGCTRKYHSRHPRCHPGQ